MHFGWDISFLILIGSLFVFHFIFGKTLNIRLIIALYISLFVTEGLVDMVSILIPPMPPAPLSLLHIDPVSILRLGLLFSIHILLLFREPFSFHPKKPQHWSLRLILHSLFSLSAALFLPATILLFFSGYSFLDGFNLPIDPHNFYPGALIPPFLLLYYKVFFMFPAFCWVLATLFFPRKTKPTEI